MTPAETRAYHAGAVAFRKGKIINDCPHHCATEANARKLRAWKRGFFDESVRPKGNPELASALETILKPGFGD